MLPGKHNSRESLDAFKEFQSKLDLLTAPVEAITINELMLAYGDYAGTYYRRADGTPTNEITLVKIVSKLTRAAFGDVPVDEFGPLKLVATRERFIAEGWSRRTVNQQVDRLRRIFRWGTEREMVAGGISHALADVEPLKAGRSAAPEAVPIRPVDPVTIAATLPFLNRHVRTMILLQQLTGMRPGEVCRIRMSEIDRTGETWTYKPSRTSRSIAGRAAPSSSGRRAGRPSKSSSPPVPSWTRPGRASRQGGPE